LLTGREPALRGSTVRRKVSLDGGEKGGEDEASKGPKK